MSSSNKDIVTYPEIEPLITIGDVNESVKEVAEKLSGHTKAQSEMNFIVTNELLKTDPPQLISSNPDHAKTSEEKMEILGKELARIESMTDEEKTLENRKRFNESMAEMEKIWNNLSRFRKRKIMNPKMKFSNQVRRILKNTK